MHTDLQTKLMDKLTPLVEFRNDVFKAALRGDITEDETELLIKYVNERRASVFAELEVEWGLSRQVGHSPLADPERGDRCPIYQ